MRKGKSKDKGCCRLNKVVLSLASLIMLIALALGSYASNPVLESPGQAGTIGQDGLINVSLTGADVKFVIINVSSPSTANSSVSMLVNISNSSGTNFNLGSANASFGFTYVLEDSNDYTWTCTTFNSSGATDACAARTSVIVDRTVPQLPTTTLPTGRQTSRAQTIQAVANDANTTSCRLTFVGSNPGSLTYTMTYSGTNCSQAFSNLASTTFRYTISASDGTNRSAETAESTFYVDIAGATGARKYIAATGGGRSLPIESSSTAQQRAFGQQTESALDRAIAKAPVNAQEGLTNAKNAVTKQYKGKEGFKTWTGTGVGCGMGALGLVVPPIAIVTIPVGCAIGHLTGLII